MKKFDLNRFGKVMSHPRATPLTDQYILWLCHYFLHHRHAEQPALLLDGPFT